MDTKELRAALMGISAYRDVMEKAEMQQLQRLLDALHAQDGEGALAAYAELYHVIVEDGYASLGGWLYDTLRYAESPYSIMLAERRSDPALTSAARNDLAVFSALEKFDCETLIGEIRSLLPGEEYRGVLDSLPRWHQDAHVSFEALTDFYDTNGAGIFSHYRAFVWQNSRLRPVKQPDCPAQDELIGYRAQREKVIANTRALLAGHAVNNVLLFGNAGTGKSATVKSLLTIPEFGDLRLVEVQKEGLSSLPELTQMLDGKRHKFILFIDDLAFDTDDRTYSVLKTILEGSIEPRPSNVAIYATSNRRTLVRQNFSDRAGDEVNARETIEEKTSLADRFGLRVPFLNLTKAEYLETVDAMARRKGITMDPELLHEKASAWELRHAGRNPRTAKQFIQSLTASD